MKLTDAACRSAKGQIELYKLSDGGGLQLWVHPTGSRTWRLAYRLGGKQRSLPLGTYPDMKLAEARDRREDAKRMIREGKDPVTWKRSDDPRPFEVIFKQWFEAAKGPWSAEHQVSVRNRMNTNIIPAIGHHDIRDLDAPKLLASLKVIEDRGSYVQAKLVRQDISRVFQFAIANGLVDQNPAFKLQGAMKVPLKVKHYPSITESELGDFIKAVSGYYGGPLVPIAMMFTIRTMVRSNESRFATWSEFERLDGDDPVWRIPGKRMKNGLEHQVPLTRQVIELLDLAKPFKRETDDLVFPGASYKGPMGNNTLLYAIYRLGYSKKATIHGFRSTASTILNESGLFNSDWIERQLSHVEKNQVRSAYNAAEWLPARRKMMQWWNDRIDIAAGKDKFEHLF